MILPFLLHVVSTGKTFPFSVSLSASVRNSLYFSQTCVPVSYAIHFSIHSPFPATYYVMSRIADTVWLITHEACQNMWESNLFHTSKKDPKIEL